VLHRIRAAAPRALPPPKRSGVARRPGAADRNGEYRVTLAEHTLQMSLGGGGGGSRIVVAKAEGVSFAAGVRAGDVLTRVVRLPTRCRSFRMACRFR
jgi:hypothetical protein